MSRRAIDIANVLLRLGVLDPDDPDQASLREELFGDPGLWEDVKARLDAVGYELVQMLGHLGVRLSKQTALAPLVTGKNNLGLDARHVRVLVYLWVHLVYRQLKETLRDEDTEPRGRHQTMFGLEEPGGSDESPTLPRAELVAEFSEEYSTSAIKGALTTL